MSAERAAPPDGIRPPRTRLFGRDAELAELARWATGPRRLATLTGGGGVGKTRLATEIALRERARRPVLFVELGSAATVAEALTTLARALGADLSGRRDTAAVTRVLGLALAARGPLLLVLDELDRIVAALAPALSELVAAAPELHLLATSRERAGLDDELAVDVAPLPSETDTALELFLDRAERAGASTSYDEPERAALRELVRRLDGLPLAIEIAAARADVLPPSRLLALLARRFEVLATTARGRDARHGSMRAAVSFSWELLPLEARLALARLAYLTGPFELAAAAAVMELAEPDARAMLELLARRSLVVRRGPTEHALLETIRDFAREVAPALGVEAAAVARRDAWFVARAEDLARRSRAAGGAVPLAALGHLREQLHAIVGEALAGGPATVESGLRAALALAHFVRRACLPPWGMAALQELCAADVPITRPVLLRGLIALARLQSDHGRRDAMETLARARDLVPPDLAGARLWLAEIAVGEGRDLFDQSRFADARDKDAEALALTDGLGPEAADVRGMALTNLTSARIRLGETDGALDNLERARQLFIEAGAHERLPIHEAITFFTESQLGQVRRGRAALVEALAVARDVGTPRDETAVEAYIGVADLDAGHLAGAREHLTAAYERSRIASERLAGQCAVVACYVALVRGDHADFARWRSRARDLLAPFGAPIELTFLEAMEAARRALAGDVAGAREQLARLDPARLAQTDSVAVAAAGATALVHLADALLRSQTGDAAGAAEELARVDALRRRLVDAADHGDDVRRVLALLDRALSAARATGAVLCVAPGVAAVRVVGPGVDRPWEDLERKPTLQRLLAALIEARVDRAGALLDADALGEAGWPGERMMEEARDNRLYVTLSKLRALGLDDTLEHLPGGWRLRLELPVLPVEPRLWATAALAERTPPTATGGVPAPAKAAPKKPASAKAAPAKAATKKPAPAKATPAKAAKAATAKATAGRPGRKESP